MRERPILFSAPMVRAILEGRKTVTRRVVKAGIDLLTCAPIPAWEAFWNCHPCPYGQPGDRLWVREAWSHVPSTAYRCSDGVQQIEDPTSDGMAAVYHADWTRSSPGRWRPSIHMPRWASRITLEVTSVRVERLQDISEDQAAAEGVHRVSVGSGYQDRFSAEPMTWADAVETDAGHEDARLAFRDLWESINGAGSWNANPWVWAVAFRRITP